MKQKLSPFEQPPQDPISWFKKWYAEADGKTNSGELPWITRRLQKLLYWIRVLIAKLYPATVIFEANAVALATADQEGRTSCRMVLFKGQSEDGFEFYTNCHSQKGQELGSNPWAAMLFYWRLPPRQVRVEGPTVKMSLEESARYWNTRPRGSQIGGLASHQSHPLSSTQEMQDIIKRLEKEYEGREIPCPEHWRGFRIVPERIEFWQGRVNRLHDRMIYKKATDGRWYTQRVFP